MQEAIKKLFALVIAIGMPLTGHTEVRLTTAGIQYSVTSDKTVTAFLTVKAQGDVIILETITIKGKTYTTNRIGPSFTKKNDYVQSVVIPNSVTQIDKNAFRNCSNLTKIVIPDAPCRIDADAFGGCMAISSVRTHSKDGKIGYLLAVIDPSNPCFTNNVVIIDDPKPDTIIIPKPEPPILADEDIDIDIPNIQQKNDRTFALIIGNEHYKYLAEVPYASNDAQIFQEYCTKTLGIPNENIEFLTDATQGEIRHGVSVLANRLKVIKGSKGIVYYAGHGIPDEKEKTAYLLPTDGLASDIESGYSLKKLYETLSDASSEHVVLFLDACFSGAKREGDMIAQTRGVAIKVRNSVPPGNLIVFAASTGDETAICDKEHRHGMFTYYLLQYIRRHGGVVNLGSLSEYVIKKVNERSVMINSGKIQTPTIMPSAALGESWEGIQLR